MMLHCQISKTRIDDTDQKDTTLKHPISLLRQLKANIMNFGIRSNTRCAGRADLSLRNTRQEAQSAKLVTKDASASLGINLTEPLTATQSYYIPSGSQAEHDTVEDYYQI